MTAQVTINQARAEKEKLRLAIQSAITEFNRATGLVCTDIRVEVIPLGCADGSMSMIQGSVSLKVQLP
jgi:hypothetical protein